jgi:hypothetical protein
MLSAMKSPLKPMVLATSAGDADAIRKCRELDHIYGVVLQSGRALLHNPSDQQKEKLVNGTRLVLPPASILEIPAKQERIGKL